MFKKVFLSGLLSAAIFAQGPVTASAFRNLDKGEKLFCTNLCKIRLGLEAGQRKLILDLNKKGVENSQAALNGILKMETNNLTKLNYLQKALNVLHHLHSQKVDSNFLPLK